MRQICFCRVASLLHNARKESIDLPKYQKGDYIRYSTSGVCLIEDIKMLDYTHSKNEREFYILKPVASAASTIYVPTENEALTAKMRYILKKDELDALIMSAKNGGIEWNDDRKKRGEHFKEIIRRCMPEELLRLVSCIYLKKRELEENGKKLSASDEAALTQAEGLIENEFSFVLNLKSSEVGSYIRGKLGM